MCYVLVLPEMTFTEDDTLPFGTIGYRVRDCLLDTIYVLAAVKFIAVYGQMY